MTPSSDWRLSVDTAIDVAKSWYIGNRAKEHLDQRTFTPMTFDVFQMNGLLFGGKSPWMVGQFLGKPRHRFRTSPVTRPVLDMSARNGLQTCPGAVQFPVGADLHQLGDDG
jgi:hypothetical protein